jgi:hypothetical protein
MALDELTLLVRVGYRGRTHVCRLDSGASKTAFYAPFLAKNRSDVESLGTSAVALPPSRGWERGARCLSVASRRSSWRWAERRSG